MLSVLYNVNLSKSNHFRENYTIASYNYRWHRLFLCFMKIMHNGNRWHPGLSFTPESNLVLTHFQLCCSLSWALDGSDFCQHLAEIDRSADRKARSHMFSFPWQTFLKTLWLIFILFYFKSVHSSSFSKYYPLYKFTCKNVPKGLGRMQLACELQGLSS